MNAQEARNLMKSAQPDKNKMNDIFLKVEIAAKSQDKSIWYYEKLDELDTKYLRSLGYTVKDESDRDGTLISISWAK